MQLDTNAQVPQGINPTDFSKLLTFLLVPPLICGFKYNVSTGLSWNLVHISRVSKGWIPVGDHLTFLLASPVTLRNNNIWQMDCQKISFRHSRCLEDESYGLLSLWVNPEFRVKALDSGIIMVASWEVLRYCSGDLCGVSCFFSVITSGLKGSALSGVLAHRPLLSSVELWV